MKYSIIIPTLNAALLLGPLLASLREQTHPPDEIIIVDSASTDTTIQQARDLACVVISIPRNDFNHGRTRNLAASHAHGDVLVFFTQDVILDDLQALENIVRPLKDPNIVAVCGRQLPKRDANPLAAHARIFNYPPVSCIKTKKDISKLGIKTAFLSNSFAAYQKSTFWKMGGFPENVIFGEDMMLAAKLILAGYGVAYQGSAAARHSHNYSPQEEFRRYFDIGVLHSRESWIQKNFGGAGGEGIRYVRSELKFAQPYGCLWVARSLLSSAMKFAGYKLGKQEAILPKSLKFYLSMNRNFWS